MKVPAPPTRRTVQIVPPSQPAVLQPNEPKPFREVGSGLSDAKRSTVQSSSSESSILSKNDDRKSSKTNSTMDLPPTSGPSPTKKAKKEKKGSKSGPMVISEEKEKSPGPELSKSDGKGSFYFYFIK